MQRIATTTVAPDLHGFGKDGFTSGNPNSGIKPTKLSARWCNDMQESVARCVEISGQTLIADDNEQLARSIPYLAGHPAPSSSTDVTFAWSSEIVPTVPTFCWMRTDSAIITPGNSAPLTYFLPPDYSIGMVDISTIAVLVGGPSSDFRERKIMRWERVGNASFSGSEVLMSGDGLIATTSFGGIGGAITVSVLIAALAPAGDYYVFVKAELTGVQYGA